MSFDHVRIFDTTLRDGEQAPGAAMTISEKLRIAHQLAKLNVDVIEAGFPISSPAQFEAVQRIAGEVKGPVICALARTIPADIRAAGEALVTGAASRIHTFIATSDIHLKAKFAADRYGRSLADKRKTILRMAQEAVTQACEVTSDVEFSAEDAGRTDPGYLVEVINAAIEAGATTINIPDTTGYCVPHEYAALFHTVGERCDLNGQVTLSTHCHDDLGLAVANSLAGVLAGARQVECTINGIGERAGNASLEEVVMALNVRRSNFGAQTAIETQLLTPTSRLVSIATGFAVPPNKAVVGGNAFSHEAGIHQHGVLKSRETYEIMRAEDVGQNAEAIRLGRHSGRHGLFSRLKSLGVHVDAERQEALYQQFVELADKKKEIFDEDLRELAQRAATGKSETSHYRLDYLRVSTSTGREPRAEVLVHHARSGTLRREIADGDGPVAAIYKAIDQASGSHHDLVSYAIRSVGEGADAMGEATVLIGGSGVFFRGVSRHTDVLRASADSYIKALNQLETFRTEEKNVEFVGDGIMQSFDSGAPQ